MAEEIACPVCELENIPPGKARCPQCDSDLTCFRVLDSIPDEPPGRREDPRTRTMKRAAQALCAGLAAALVAVHFVLLARLERRVTGISAALERRGRSPAQASPTAREATGPATPGDPMRPGDGGASFQVHRVKAGDTLWSISKRYYGSGRFYPVLIEHNPHLSVYSLDPGDAVRVLRDAAQAREIYGRFGLRTREKAFWDYRVREGDTLRTVAGRFYKAGRGARSIAALNPGLEPRPGGRIRIRLEHARGR